jgi:hypothetical protein
MFKVKSTVKINKQKVKEIEKTTLKSLEQTAEATKTELINKGYIPFDSGTLQNDETFVDLKDLENGKVSIITGPTPYARRIYFNADGFTIHTGKNANARDHWFEPFISGQDKDFIKDTFKEFMKRNL